MTEKKEKKINNKKNKAAENATAEVDKESKKKVDEAPADEGAQATAKENEEVKEAAESSEDLKGQVKVWNDRYLRLMAEFDNYKKRSSREYQTMVDGANEKIMTDLVDVRENFERAIKNGEQSSDYQNLFEGLKLIFSKFETVLNKYGLEVFAEPGDVFDPQVHDALMKTSHAEIPEDHIAEIYERGYLLKGKVMKHARVIVSSGKPEDGSGEEESKK